VNIVDRFDYIIGIAAFIAALAMMIGTALAVLGAGIWIFRKALHYGNAAPASRHELEGHPGDAEKHR
jgi:hypothetical protein